MNQRIRNWNWIFVVALILYCLVLTSSLEYCEEDPMPTTRLCSLLKLGSSSPLNVKSAAASDFCEEQILTPCVTKFHTTPKTTVTVLPASVTPIPPSVSVDEDERICEEERSRCDMSQIWLTTKAAVDLKSVRLTVSATKVPISPPSDEIPYSSDEVEEGNCEEERSRCDMSHIWLTTTTAVNLNSIRLTSSHREHEAPAFAAATQKLEKDTSASAENQFRYEEGGGKLIFHDAFRNADILKHQQLQRSHSQYLENGRMNTFAHVQRQNDKEESESFSKSFSTFDSTRAQAQKLERRPSHDYVQALELKSAHGIQGQEFPQLQEFRGTHLLWDYFYPMKKHRRKSRGLPNSVNFDLVM